MSTALASFKRIEIKSVHQAGAEHKIAHNQVVFGILPPIVAELEGKINELQIKIDHILDEMKWHPNAISSGTAHPALQSAAATYKGGRKIICYTGINAKKSGKHSVRNFKRVTRKFHSKQMCKTMKCPKRNNIKRWVNLFGAEYRTPEECDKIVIASKV